MSSDPTYGANIPQDIKSRFTALNLGMDIGSMLGYELIVMPLRVKSTGETVYALGFDCQDDLLARTGSAGRFSAIAIMLSNEMAEDLEVPEGI